MRTKTSSTGSICTDDFDLERLLDGTAPSQFAPQKKSRRQRRRDMRASATTNAVLLGLMGTQIQEATAETTGREGDARDEEFLEDYPLFEALEALIESGFVLNADSLRDRFNPLVQELTEQRSIVDQSAVQARAAETEPQAALAERNNEVSAEPSPISLVQRFVRTERTDIRDPELGEPRFQRLRDLIEEGRFTGLSRLDRRRAALEEIERIDEAVVLRSADTIMVSETEPSAPAERNAIEEREVDVSALPIPTSTPASAEPPTTNVETQDAVATPKIGDKVLPEEEVSAEVPTEPLTVALEESTDTMRDIEPSGDEQRAPQPVPVSSAATQSSVSTGRADQSADTGAATADETELASSNPSAAEVTVDQPSAATEQDNGNASSDANSGIDGDADRQLELIAATAEPTPAPVDPPASQNIEMPEQAAAQQAQSIGQSPEVDGEAAEMMGDQISDEDDAQSPLDTQTEPMPVEPEVDPVVEAQVPPAETPSMADGTHAEHDGDPDISRHQHPVEMPHGEGGTDLEHNHDEAAPVEGEPSVSDPSAMEPAGSDETHDVPHQNHHVGQTEDTNHQHMEDEGHSSSHGTHQAEASPGDDANEDSTEGSHSGADGLEDVPHSSHDNTQDSDDSGSHGQAHTDHAEVGSSHEDPAEMGHMHSGHSHGAHPDDPLKMSEHNALLNLVPISDATHIATSNGSWFDPATWAGGEVPGEGANVLISSGVTVDYDGESPASLMTVRVDGELDFATDKDTFMEVDTFVVSPVGTLSIGKVGDPVQADVSAVISIADNGPIDVDWDPSLLSRGLISHGEINIHGTEKENFLKVRTDPMRGDTSIELDGGASGWQAGDTVVVTGTRLVEVERNGPRTLDQAETQDEERVISRIEGNRIYFDEPLVYDHDGPRDDLKAYVSNQSRNVRIETENADDLPVHQRGHVMLMHSDDIDVRYAEFLELGRTDKSERAVDVGDLSTVTADANIKGRYSLHIHRAGVSDIDDPAMLIGNAVTGVPGWGIVHHDSNAIINSNNVYDIIGSGFVSESGNEIGRWEDNIAIKALGMNTITKNGPDTNAFDLGRTGAGFWFQSRMVEAVDNVAAGIPGGMGFVYYSRGSNPEGLQIDTSSTNQPDIFGYQDTAQISLAPIQIFKGNEAIAVETGFEAIRPGTRQGHDLRSIISDFTAWEVERGVHLDYTTRYTFKDIDLVSSRESHVRAADNSAFELDRGVVDMAFNNVSIDGFETGFDTSKELQPGLGLDVNLDIFNYVFIDIDFQNTNVQYSNVTPSDTFLSSDQLIEGRLDLETNLDNIGVVEFDEYGRLNIDGIKTDSIGEAPLTNIADRKGISGSGLINAIDQNGFWVTDDGRYVGMIEEYFSDRATGIPNKKSLFFELTDNQIRRIEREGWSDEKFNGVLDQESGAPVAVADSASVSAGGRVTIDVLSNDFDPDGDEIRLDGIFAEHGRIVANDDGTITYFADEDFSGEDEFWYWILDENGQFQQGTVNVSVFG
ncbi:MAG: G8 domain-containing protein [Pseudomonadota bacterium]